MKVGSIYYIPTFEAEIVVLSLDKSGWYQCRFITGEYDGTNIYMLPEHFQDFDFLRKIF